MKRHASLWVVTLLALALFTVSAFAADSGTDYSISAGARTHSEHAEFPELPYGDKDVSWGLAWECQDNGGVWQIAIDYAPDVSGTNNVDYVLTPQLNLLFRDGIWVGGIGILQSYVAGTETGNDWTDLYWQFTLGLRIPVGGLDLTVQSYYVFDQWSKLDEFDGKELDYGAWLSYRF